MLRVNFFHLDGSETTLIREISDLDRAAVGDEGWSVSSLAEECRREGGHLTAALDEQGRLLGFALYSAVLDEGNLNSIAVSEEFREKSVGSDIMEEMIDTLADEGVKTIWLEVRASNQTAVKLYEKFGFILSGLRKNFYNNPKEDGLIYSKVV